MGGSIVVIDDEPDVRHLLARTLTHEAFTVSEASNATEGLSLIEESAPDLVLLDVNMPGTSGLDLLSSLRDQGNDVAVIVVSGAGSIDDAVRALKLGAFDYIQKPLRGERLLVTVRNALRFTKLEQAHRLLQADSIAANIIGDSAPMARLKELVSKVAPSDGRVLIMGENGTGKELVAAAIHAGSPRAPQPFIRLNCGAVPDNLIESELFGHEKGAFTGAAAARKGRFELADGGTLLLDEIGDMPMPMQVKLLRVLQEGRFERVGGSRTLEVDVRVLAATNRDLAAMVDEGTFREDLYYRLNVVTLQVPPLRERRDDIPMLIAHFTRAGSKGDGLRVSDGAMELLQQHNYPGNVRELENLIERLAILHGKGTVSTEAVREMLHKRNGRSARKSTLYEEGRSLRELLDEVEARLIVEAIAAHGGSKPAAAEALQCERSHFYKKCRQHAIGGAK